MGDWEGKLNKEALLTVYDRQLRFESADPLHERQAVPQDDPVVVRHAPRDPQMRWGWVIWSRLNAEIADQVIGEQVEFFKRRGQNFEWKRYAHDLPADLDERLLRHGFTPDDRETVMVLDLAEHPPETRFLAETGFLQEQGVEVRRVTDRADLHTVVEIEDAVWNEPHGWILDELSKELALPGAPMLMFLAYADGVPAAAAWMRFLEGTEFASLFGGSTLPQFRHRGLYRALLAARAQAALERGRRFLDVDASEMSRPILEKHGFVKITTATAYKYRLPATAD